MWDEDRVLFIKKNRKNIRKNNQNSLLIAGGGTGGHLLAGISVADIWAAKIGESGKILFVGSKGGIEEKLIPTTRYALQLLTLGSLNRVSLSRKVKTLLQLPIALYRAGRILLAFRPAVILGVGGYSSGPVVLMGKILKKIGLLQVKVTILEQNKVPGLTNRILGKVVDEVFTAFEGMEPYFPKKKVVFTGNPIRSSMKFMESAPRVPFTVFVFGGSQGARGINNLVLDALPYLSTLKTKLRFIHQTGEKDYLRVLASYEKLSLSHETRVEKFIYDMPVAYQSASLLICRAGASTLAEIAAVGRASILIPLPTASDNHQAMNAQAFENAGAARILNQMTAQGKDLGALIVELMTSSTQIIEMERKVIQFYRPHAAANIVDNLYV
jgi:UDP-N-acetylglucosamine--N-acetylmuramyl-(pentapeptide) pyrophosphoryl-undecaprenol N-acetylglucosamine transferase